MYVSFYNQDDVTFDTQYISSRYTLDCKHIEIYIRTSENFDYGWEYLQTSYKLENKRTTKTLNNVE